jgi:hypothetical protein
MLREPEEALPKIEENDLRSITRESERCLTVVTLHLNWEKRVTWLKLGQVQLRHQRDSHDGRWRLEAYLPAGVTDFEHDSAYLIKLPLIGVVFEGIDYHQTKLIAWVDSSEPRDFHVPLPGYNPMEHPKAFVCDEKDGGYRCKTPHKIIPEDLYVPPFNRELFDAVKGKKVEILVTPVFPKEEQ